MPALKAPNTPTLYHTPFACSMAARIAAHEAELELDIIHVDLNTHETEMGTSFLDINPLGQVSTLTFANGTLLTETSAVLLWIQSHSKNQAFRRQSGTEAYFQMLRWIGFCATELHKQIFRIVFYDEATDPVKNRIRALAPARFDVLETQLSQRPYLLGEQFSAADAYLTWALFLSERAGIAPVNYPVLQAYLTRAQDRPSVKAVIAADSRYDEKNSL